jgi:hypothetical protein
MLLQQLIKLTESGGAFSRVFKNVDIWVGHQQAELDTTDVVVEYDYEPASYTDHPYGSTTTREYHPIEIDILSIRLKRDTNILDEDGDIVGMLEAGSDLTTQPWWQESFYDYFINKLKDIISKENDYFNEPDDYYSRY